MRGSRKEAGRLRCDFSTSVRSPWPGGAVIARRGGVPVDRWQGCGAPLASLVSVLVLPAVYSLGFLRIGDAMLSTLAR